MSHSTIERQAPVALLAITQHMVDQCLAAPVCVDIDAEGVVVTVYPRDAIRWLATVHVDAASQTERPAYVTHRHSCRLPDTGVTFQLRQVVPTSQAVAS